MQAKNILYKVDDLKVSFATGASKVRAVDGVSFQLRQGETVALVGESGCGKSVTALSLARLVPQPPGHYEGGHIYYEDTDVLTMNDRSLRRLRGNEISYIFQEPNTSLNPVFTIGDQISEALRLHRKDISLANEVVRLLTRVGIPDPEERVKAYPHQLSGGMQQRVMIAMALACNPKLLVADEPTTALDVTIQAQILELLVELQEQLGMAVLLITHNLGLVADMAHWIHVMYAGRIVESGPAKDVLRAPKHPYTRGLLDAVPRLEGSQGRLKGIAGSVPNPAHLPSGCRFHPRCPFQQDRCVKEEPAMEAVDEERTVRCHFWEESLKGEGLLS